MTCMVAKYNFSFFSFFSFFLLSFWLIEYDCVMVKGNFFLFFFAWAFKCKNINCSNLSAKRKGKKKKDQNDVTRDARISPSILLIQCYLLLSEGLAMVNLLAFPMLSDFVAQLAFVLTWSIHQLHFFSDACCSEGGAGLPEALCFQLWAGGILTNLFALISWRCWSSEKTWG